MTRVLIANGKVGPAFTGTKQITSGFILFDYRTLAIIGIYDNEAEAKRLAADIEFADYMSHGQWLTQNDIDQYNAGLYSFHDFKKKIEPIHDVWSGNPDTDKFWR